MYQEYKRLCKNNKFTLADVYAYKHENGWVFNLGTQQSWKTKADIIAVEAALRKMGSLMIESNVEKVVLPAIGAGLGGLDWPEVKSVMKKIADEYTNLTFIVIESYSPSLSHEGQIG